MTDVTSSIYTSPDGRSEHRIKFRESVRKQFPFAQDERYYLVPIVNSSGSADYEFKVVTSGVASRKGAHRYWDGGDVFLPAYLVTAQDRLEIAVGTVDLPAGEYEAAVVDDTMILQRVVEAKSWTIKAWTISSGVCLALPRDLLEYVGFDAGQKFYRNKTMKGNFAIWTPGKERGSGGSIEVKFPQTKIVMSYPDLGRLVEGEWEVEVLVQKDPWTMEFNLSPILGVEESV